MIEWCREREWGEGCPGGGVAESRDWGGLGREKKRVRGGERRGKNRAGGVGRGELREV